MKMESYICNIKNEKERIAITKFRLSNHRLMIEIGRHTGINKEFRFCKFCPNLIEDEIHFLTTCKTFEKQRNELMDKIRRKKELNFACMDKNSVFVFLMGNGDIAPLVAKYIRTTLEIRQFLINSHKRQI